MTTLLVKSVKLQCLSVNVWKTCQAPRNLVRNAVNRGQLSAKQ